MKYTVSFPEPASHSYQVQFYCSGWNHDSIYLKMPNWMPGYYQLMDYAKNVQNLTAHTEGNKSVPVEKVNGNTWLISSIKNKAFFVNYKIVTSRQFVANSYVDSSHAYLIPENTFLYIKDHIQQPVFVTIDNNASWKNVATGLMPVAGKLNVFSAPDFDILYDCPILFGDLTELPSFKVRGINHRFLGYDMGHFDSVLLMQNLHKVVQAATDIIGDIPYKEYTFIGIGPGRGGIEHLNNTTISFDGSGLDQPGAMNKVMNFIAHEFFHNYNVKRIRAFELGPFDYDKGSKTNLLWVNEGLNVYYEYLIVKRAGLSDLNTLLADFSGNLNTVQHNPGRLYQSLQQSSYATWADGPFGTQGTEKGKTISYYEKGPLVGLMLDFAIRNATENKKSLDDVMRMLYWNYYKGKQRGFTDAEFQQTCEETAGIPLTELFEYVYTTKEPNYDKYFSYGGLQINKQIITTEDNKQEEKFSISKINQLSPLQKNILASWLGE
ncbi:MAG: M61 family metallopeptidase [Bacteroidetes bacterium]|nr:M61 family metallopeptidase [Bacteroidota bacterium]